MRPPAPWDEGQGATTLPTGAGKAEAEAEADAEADAEETPDTASAARPNGAAADGEYAPQRPPAPDDERRTGGARGPQRAEGEAEARRTEGEAEARRTEGEAEARRTEGEAEARRPEGEAEARRPEGEAEARRIQGLLLGLAAGDAAGWPAARHRATRLPDWTRRLARELDTFAEQHATTTLPVPLALNQPPQPLHLGPSDDAEWAALAAQALLLPGDDTRAAIDLTWNALAAEATDLRARISVRAGLTNLAAGLRPPATGHDNPHYFDDAACVRACVLAAAHPGAPERAAALAEFDARYTQDGDGVHGARAMAAALSEALAGADVTVCVRAALTQLPEATEIGRNARHALRLAEATGTAFALVPLLEHEIVDHVYSYGIAAAETVPVALALALAAKGRIAEAVPAAACLSRLADSAPALTGALTGALGGADAVPASWQNACRTLSGCVLPRLTGTDLVELAGLLEAAQPAPPGG